MRAVIIITLEELRKLERGEVIHCEIMGRDFSILCTDNMVEAMTLLDMDEGRNPDED